MSDVNIFSILRDWLTTKSEESGKNLNEKVSDAFLEHLIKANHILNAEQNETENAVDTLCAVLAYSEENDIQVSDEVLNEVLKLRYNVETVNLISSND